MWKVARQEVTSWSTPIVYHFEGRRQLIVSGTERVRSYDLNDGSVIWECGGMSANIVASPVAGAGMVFVGSSYEKRAFLGIKLRNANGDITGTDNVVWQRTTRTPYVPSPLLYGDRLYYLRHYQGILSRVTPETGADIGSPVRLAGMRDIYASPVGAADRVYVTDRVGTTAVLDHAPIPRIIAVNRLDDRFNASAAVSEGEIFLRGEKNLYCIGKKEIANEQDEGQSESRR